MEGSRGANTIAVAGRASGITNQRRHSSGLQVQHTNLVVAEVRDIQHSAIRGEGNARRFNERRQCAIPISTWK